MRHQDVDSVTQCQCGVWRCEGNTRTRARVTCKSENSYGNQFLDPGHCPLVSLSPHLGTSSFTRYIPTPDSLLGYDTIILIRKQDSVYHTQGGDEASFDCVPNFFMNLVRSCCIVLVHKSNSHWSLAQDCVTEQGAAS